jgi:5-methylcytosine-specific restriction endonuclease McrA
MTEALKKKIDKKFNEYIRLRDTRDDDTFICISCGERKKKSQMDAGHYYSRRFMSTRWNEKNVNGQCKYCNNHLSGHGAGYAVGLIRKYGASVLEELEILHSHTSHLSQWEGEMILKEYTEKIKELKRQRKLRSLNKPSI